MTVALPCILLSYQSSVYASFAPLLLLNGSTSNPKDVFFVDSKDLFYGSIDEFIFVLLKSLHINTDVILHFQDMDLDLHSDSYMTGQLSLQEIHNVYKDLRLVQNYTLDKIPPLKVKILEMSSCFKNQFYKLKQDNLDSLKSKRHNPYLNKGDEENPIAIEDDKDLDQDDQVIIIDDDDDHVQKLTRPFIKRRRRGIKIVCKDLRGSSQISRFLR